ncbi:hypothetical protein HY634_01260 [Candidatus Uhrbacteria bacterium]|nr:hypothetical protein [Candidatus Uhrbacteria bacterium]
MRTTERCVPAIAMIALVMLCGPSAIARENTGYQRGLAPTVAFVDPLVSIAEGGEFSTPTIDTGGYGRLCIQAYEMQPSAVTIETYFRMDPSLDWELLRHPEDTLLTRPGFSFRLSNEQDQLLRGYYCFDELVAPQIKIVVKNESVVRIAEVQLGVYLE